MNAWPSHIAGSCEERAALAGPASSQSTKTTPPTARSNLTRPCERSHLDTVSTLLHGIDLRPPQSHHFPPSSRYVQQR